LTDDGVFQVVEALRAELARPRRVERNLLRLRERLLELKPLLEEA
jgi:hypothetical protein